MKPVLESPLESHRPHEELLHIPVTPGLQPNKSLRSLSPKSVQVTLIIMSNILETYYRGIAQQLRAEVDFINTIFTHQGVKGDGNESILRNLLKTIYSKKIWYWNRYNN